MSEYDVSGGNYNTCIGYKAGYAITTGSQNIAIGTRAIESIVNSNLVKNKIEKRIFNYSIKKRFEILDIR